MSWSSRSQLASVHFMCWNSEIGKLSVNLFASELSYWQITARYKFIDWLLIVYDAITDMTSIERWRHLVWLTTQGTRAEFKGVTGWSPPPEILRFDSGKCVNMRLRPGLAADPTGGAYSAPQSP